MTSKPRVVVVGAGAFGGWTALALARRGAAVTLVDAWAPGHVRSSSGGETRIIRATYGRHAVFTRMAVQALERWRAHERRFATGLLRETGALWMFQDDDRLARTSAATLAAYDVRVEEIDREEARRRFPQIAFDGLARIWIEPDAGYLLASRACAEIAARAAAEGAAVRTDAVRTPIALDRDGVRLADGSTLAADAFVFACGPWLGSLFPDVIGARIVATRQEVHYFGTPAGDPRFADPALPVWLDCGARIRYGIPGDSGRGFKIADDTLGPVLDPTTDQRVPSAEALADARAFLERRFPALTGAPLVASEVCQYESTPDAHFIIDRHPHDDRVWIVGGGSGHGFKMGPVIGALLAGHLLDEVPVDPVFALARLDAPPPGGWVAKWA